VVDLFSEFVFLSYVYEKGTVQFVDIRRGELRL
jgi:hypothetical protein